MTAAELSSPLRRRRSRERGQGRREKRVNLRLSGVEHDLLEASAARHGTTLAGYVSAAALSAARDELPPDAREACVRLFGMQADLKHLRAAHGIASGALADAVYAMREALEEAAEEFINLSRKARGRRALRTRPLALATTAAAPQQRAAPVAPATSTPATARDWATQLAELTRQLDDGGGTVAHQQWHHRRLYNALDRAIAALDRAHPGGIKELLRRR